MVKSAINLVHYTFSFENIMTLDLKPLFRRAIKVASLCKRYSFCGAALIVNDSSIFYYLFSFFLFLIYSFASSTSLTSSSSSSSIYSSSSPSSSSCSPSSSSSDETYSFASFPYSSSESKSGWSGLSYFFCTTYFTFFAASNILWRSWGAFKPSN